MIARFWAWLHAYTPGPLTDPAADGRVVGWWVLEYGDRIDWDRWEETP